MQVIRSAFGERDVLRKSTLLSRYESLHRYQGEGVRKYTSRYLRTERELLEVGIDISKTYDNEARGHRLLSTAFLPEDGVRNVITGARHSFDFEQVRESMVLLYPEHKAPPPVYRPGLAKGDGGKGDGCAASSNKRKGG